MKKINELGRHKSGGGALVLTLLLATGISGSAVASGQGQRVEPRVEAAFGVGVPAGSLTEDGLLTLSGERGAYRVVADELLVQLQGPADPARAKKIIAGLGLNLREVGRYSGILRVGLPGKMSLEEGRRHILRHAEVASAWPNAVMGGNTTGAYGDWPDVAAAAYGNHQWALSSLRIEEGQQVGPTDLSQVTVAVLDTGVAYEDYVEDGVNYVRHPAFSGTTFVNPYDAIQLDDHANDDHRHGTHVAGVIAAQGGKTVGAAPGVNIMPVKVLDSEMIGTELSLAEGILHATASGANIINMSLSFGLGYFPSAMLQEAIAIAKAEGVIMVASTGNSGTIGVGYPAAFPEVLAVGATRLSVDGADVEDLHAHYSSWGFQVDLLAPGGMMEGDLDGDGQPDGILAPAFPPGQPHLPEYWYYAGTSQAAPHIAAMAAYLIADGVAPELVGPTLKQAGNTGCAMATNLYCGAGQPDLVTARNLALTQAPASVPINVTTWLETNSTGELVGVAEVKAVDPDLSGPIDVLIGGGWFGSYFDSDVSGWTGSDGKIRFVTPPLDPAIETAIAFQVNQVWQAEGDIAASAVGFYGLSPAMAEMISELTITTEGQNPVLLFEVSPGQNAPLANNGGQISPSYLVKNLGPGLPTGPMSMTLSPSMLDLIAGPRATYAIDDFAGYLESGVGHINQMPVMAAQTEDALILTLPYDPALSQFTVTNFYPVLNAAPRDFVSANTAFGNKISRNGLEWRYPTFLTFGFFESDSLGTGLLFNAYGTGFSESDVAGFLGSGKVINGMDNDGYGFAALGTGFYSSTMGAGFYSSTMGAGFYSSTMGAGFYSSTMGAGFYSSTIGAGFFSSTMGVGFFSSTMGAGEGVEVYGTGATEGYALGTTPPEPLIPTEEQVPPQLQGLPPAE